jgi:hypothetical protein
MMRVGRARLVPVSQADAAEVRAYRALRIGRAGPAGPRGRVAGRGLPAPRPGYWKRLRARSPGAPLVSFLDERGYALVRPLDLSPVPIRGAWDSTRPGVRARPTVPLSARRDAERWAARCRLPRARDRFLLAAPWARDVRRMVT